MSFLTYGLYELYWFFRNWRAIKLQENKKISPFWRSVLSVFYCYTLFKRILKAADRRGYKNKQSPGSLTFLYVILVIISSKAPSPFDIIGILSFIPIIYVNNAIRFNNGLISAQFQEQIPLTKGEIIFLIVGALIWTAMILDLLSPVTAG